MPAAIRPLNVPSQPAPPKAVVAARAKLEKLIEQLALIDEQITTAEADVTEARKADVRHVADEAHAGRVVDDPHEREHAAKRKTEQARAPREGITLAIREAIGALIDAIKDNHAKWQTAIDSDLEAAHAEYVQAVDQAQAAARKLAAARGADRWLQQFTPEYLANADPRARRDWPTSYAGSDKLEVDVRLNANQARTATELLSAARTLDARPAPPREPRRLVIAAATRGDGSRRIGDTRPNAAGWR